jgi:hypothetical protein
MRKRLRKKQHREYISTICAYVATFDSELRDRLLRSNPGTPFRVEGTCNPRVVRMIRWHQLRYWITVRHKLSPQTAVVAYWAEEFPNIRDEAVIFATTDLRLNVPDCG